MAQLRLANHAGGAHAAREGLSDGLRGRRFKHAGWRPRNESETCSLRGQSSSVDFAIEDAVAVQQPKATGTERTNPDTVSRGIFMAATATTGTRLGHATQKRKGHTKLAWHSGQRGQTNHLRQAIPTNNSHSP